MSIVTAVCSIGNELSRFRRVYTARIVADLHGGGGLGVGGRLGGREHRLHRLLGSIPHFLVQQVPLERVRRPLVVRQLPAQHQINTIGG